MEQFLIRGSQGACVVSRPTAAAVARDTFPSAPPKEVASRFGDATHGLSALNPQ